MVIRNENAPLPFLLRHYAERGFGQFFIADCMPLTGVLE